MSSKASKKTQSSDQSRRCCGLCWAGATRELGKESGQLWHELAEPRAEEVRLLEMPMDHPGQAGLPCGTHKWLILSEMAGHQAQKERLGTVYLGKAGKRVWEIAVSHGGHLRLPSV